MDDGSSLVMMAIVQGEDNLIQNLPDDVFPNPIVVVLRLLDCGCYISSTAILHDDPTQLLPLVYEAGN